MSRDPQYSPFRGPMPAPRVAQQGELLMEFHIEREHRFYRVELRDHEISRISGNRGEPGSQRHRSKPMNFQDAALWRRLTHRERIDSIPHRATIVDGVKRDTHPPLPMTVAVINSNDDLVRIVREALEGEGYAVATAHIAAIKSGALDLKQFLLDHRPHAIIYDLAPPYAENWQFLQLLRNTPEFADAALVLTTVNKRALEHQVGSTDAFEVLGTRDNLAPIVAATNHAVRVRRQHPHDASAVLRTRRQTSSRRPKRRRRT